MQTCVCVCLCVHVCWPSQALWPSETAAQPTTSINLVDGLPRRWPFLAHKPYEHVCACVRVCMCIRVYSTEWLLCVLVRLDSKSESQSKAPLFSPSPIPATVRLMCRVRAGVRSSSWANKQSMFIIYLRLFTLAFYVFLFTLLRTAICLRANEISATDWLPLKIVASFGSHMAKLHQLCVLWSYLLLLACCQLPGACKWVKPEVDENGRRHTKPID